MRIYTNRIKKNRSQEIWNLKQKQEMQKLIHVPIPWRILIRLSAKSSLPRRMITGIQKILTPIIPETISMYREENWMIRKKISGKKMKKIITTVLEIGRASCRERE